MAKKSCAKTRRHPAYVSLRTALFFETFARLSLVVIITTVVTFFLAGNQLKVRTTAQLQSAAITKDNLLETTIAKQREQLSILGRDPFLASLPSVTNLVGFRQLLKIDPRGTITTLSSTKEKMPVFDTAALRESRSDTETFFRAVFTDEGWSAYLVSAPQINGRGDRIGTLVAVFDPSALAAQLLEKAYLGKTAEVLLVTEQKGEYVLFHSSDSRGNPVPIHLSEQDYDRTALFRQAITGKEGVEDAIDYAGINVLAAYQSIPSIGWGIIVQLDRYELLEPVVRLAMNLVGTGFLLVVLLSFSIFFLAERIIGPLEELTRKLNDLEARHWRFSRSIYTRNELEIVDCAAEDLTKRLRQAHTHLEDIVKERTQALRAQHAEDAAILESIDYGLLVTNRNGEVVYINRAGELLTGWRSAEAVGASYDKILSITDRNGKKLPTKDHPLTAVLLTKRAFNPDQDPALSLQCKNKTSSALHLRATPILRGQQCLGAVAVFRDITEERRIDRLKSDFISLVSHQLRTPLSSMRWYLEMILAKDVGPLTKGQQQYVEEVATSNTRMVHLVDALLNVSRLELGKMQLIPETIDIVHLCKEIGDSFKLELNKKKMSIDVSSKERATIEVQSDKGLLQLIVENLISNAIKYGRDNTTIDAELMIDRSKKLATISVTNSGIGIPENQQMNVFTKLFRGTNAKLSDTQGSGLGLYISRTAAESIGGKLTFKSKEGTKTTFSLTFPIVIKQKGED